MIEAIHTQRTKDHVGIAANKGDGLGHIPETVGIIAFIAEAGQAAHPIGRQQAERIPALRPP